MKRFYDLHGNDQIMILSAVLTLLASSKRRAIEQVATDRGISPRELWRDLCGEVGVENCEPWPEFPDVPQNLAPPVGEHRPVVEGLVRELNELRGAMKS